MKKLLFLSVMLLMVVCCSQPSQYVQISGYAQGSNYSVKLNMKGIKVPVETIRDSIDALIVKIDTTLSGYNKKSLISRFNAGEKIPSNAMFMDVYRLGYRLASVSATVPSPPTKKSRNCCRKAAWDISPQSFPWWTVT